MVQDLSLIAIHCHQKYVPTFLHGLHRSRIDFIFLRNFQIRWRHLRAQVDHRFEWIGIHQGPQHRPLLIHLPRWNAVRKPPTQIPTINCFRLRQEMLESTPRWLRFEQTVQSCILRHSDVHTTNPIQNCLHMETQIRALWLEHFPPIYSIPPTNE